MKIANFCMLLSFFFFFHIFGHLKIFSSPSPKILILVLPLIHWDLGMIPVQMSTDKSGVSPVALEIALELLENPLKS